VIATAVEIRGGPGLLGHRLHADQVAARRVRRVQVEPPAAGRGREAVRGRRAAHRDGRAPRYAPMKVLLGDDVDALAGEVADA